MKKTAGKRVDMTAAIGAADSGKSALIVGGLKAKAPARLIVWDPHRDYSRFGQVFDEGADRRARLKLIDNIALAKTFSTIYQPGDQRKTVVVMANGKPRERDLYAERFDWLCRVVYSLGNLVFIVEELADVTSPQSAPDSWSVLTRQGGHRGLKIIATSQRPASVDKDFLGNCTLIHCGRVLLAPDQRTMANQLGMPDPKVLATLRDFEFYQRNMKTGERRGPLLLPSPY
jgi:hypothetical protein